MDIDLKTDNKSLRQFGYLMACLIPIVFGLVLPWVWDKDIPKVPFGIGIVLGLQGFIYPASLKYVYIGWMKIGLILGWINTRLILSFVFYIFISPIAIFFKLIKRDAMKRKYNQKDTSYRIAPSGEESSEYDRVKRMKFPF